FPIGDDRYFVRNGGTETGGAGWRLYRIPFRTDTLLIGNPSLRQVQSLRITVVAPAPTGSEVDLPFALSRVRLVGSTWVKRADTPISGLGGELGTGVGGRRPRVFHQGGEGPGQFLHVSHAREDDVVGTRGRGPIRPLARAAGAHRAGLAPR